MRASLRGTSRILLAFAAALLTLPVRAAGPVPARVVDIPTRPGVTERILLLAPPQPKAAVVLFAGGQGGLLISDRGTFVGGEDNFLVRTRRLFAARGLEVAVLDTPSDRRSPPYLGGFRQTPEHVADVKAVIAWLRGQAAIPVWLVGTSRGTQSVAFVTTRLPRAAGGPDGIVLTSTILIDKHSRAVPEMALGRIVVPVLLVHHKDDACPHCPYALAPALLERLSAAPRKALFTFEGGSTRGNPCHAWAHHGYNGIEDEVVAKIAAWIESP